MGKSEPLIVIKKRRRVVRKQKNDDKNEKLIKRRKKLNADNKEQAEQIKGKGTSIYNNVEHNVKKDEQKKGKNDVITDDDENTFNVIHNTFNRFDDKKDYIIDYYKDSNVIKISQDTNTIKIDPIFKINRDMSMNTMEEKKDEYYDEYKDNGYRYNHEYRRWE